MAVLLHHVDPRLLPGGYVGVDVFFVLSGYLITTIICRDIDAGVFTFTRFYARRVKRLLPAAVTLAIVILAAGFAVFLPRDYKNLGATTIAYMGMASNFAFWLKDGYFEAQNRQWPLLHTWSLAVEEQFYLLYPAFLLLATHLRMRLGLLVTALLASFVLCVSRTALHGTDAYYLLPTRGWELLAGGVLALCSAPRIRPYTEALLGAIAVVAISAPFLFFDETTPFPGWHAALPVGGTALLVWVMQASTSYWRMLFAAAFLRGLGLISYSLYLWHWPLLVFAKYPWSAAPASCPKAIAYGAGALSIPVAFVFYRFVENPGRMAVCNDRAVLWAGVVSSVLVAIVGAGIFLLDGVAARMPEDARIFAAAMSDAHDRQTETMGLRPESVRHGTAVRLGALAEEGQPSMFALWGDSHADALVPAFDALGKEFEISGECFCRAATPPIPELRFGQPHGHFVDHDFTEAVVARLLAKPPDAVILAAKWTGILKCDIHVGEHRCMSDGEKISVCTTALQHLITRLRIAGVRRVWLVRNVPEQQFNVPRQFAMNLMYGKDPPTGISRSRHEINAANADKMLESCQSATVGIIDLPKEIFRRTEGLLTEDRIPWYVDSHHLSARGSVALMPVVEPVFVDLRFDHLGKREGP